MNLERYQLITNEATLTFEFISKGPKGHITKWIRYVKFDDENIYNLGFGDKKDNEDDFDDEVVTDNKDSQKVLATVAISVLQFTENRRDTWVFATGSTKSRTRLYQIGIAQNLVELRRYFYIYGLIINKWVKFEKNISYDAFLVKRK